MNSRYVKPNNASASPLFRTALERLLAGGLLFFALAVTLLPYVWMLSASFKIGAEIYAPTQSFLPQHPAVGNYQQLLSAPGSALQLINSLIYAGGSTLANLFTCSLAGYAFARLHFRGKKWLFMMIICLLMIPSQSQIIPVFLIIKHIPLLGGNDWFGVGGTGLLNTFVGMILPNAATPFGIFLMRQFFVRIPVEFEESARIDGANTLTIFWRIILPLSRPALSVLAVLSFQNTWNDFVWPLVLTSTRDMTNLQTGLQLLINGPDTQWNLVMAAATLITLPMIIVFIGAQRYFIGSAMSSGVKS